MIDADHREPENAKEGVLAAIIRMLRPGDVGEMAGGMPQPLHRPGIRAEDRLDPAMKRPAIGGDVAGAGRGTTTERKERIGLTFGGGQAVVEAGVPPAVGERTSGEGGTRVYRRVDLGGGT